MDSMWNQMSTDLTVKIHEGLFNYFQRIRETDLIKTLARADQKTISEMLRIGIERNNILVAGAAQIVLESFC